MAVTALLKLSQGVSTPPAGQALKGTVGTPVTLENGNNTSVDTWEYRILSVPIGSSVPIGIVGTLSLEQFTPDVRGSYRIKITVDDGAGDVKSDIRVFAAGTSTNDWLIPAYLGTDAEHNFNAQERGWAGDNVAARALDSILADIDSKLNFQGGLATTTSITVNGAVTLPEQGVDPVAVTNAGRLYTKDVAGVTELFYKNTAGTIQMTTGGSIGSQTWAQSLTQGNVTPGGGTANPTITNGDSIVFNTAGAETGVLTSNTSFGSPGMLQVSATGAGALIAGIVFRDGVVDAGAIFATNDGSNTVQVIGTDQLVLGSPDTFIAGTNALSVLSFAGTIDIEAFSDLTLTSPAPRIFANDDGAGVIILDGDATVGASVSFQEGGVEYARIKSSFGGSQGLYFVGSDYAYVTFLNPSLGGGQPVVIRGQESSAGSGGFAFLQGGSGTASGGGVDISGANAGFGGNGNGGSVFIKAGDKDGSGSEGVVQIGVTNVLPNAVQIASTNTTYFHPTVQFGATVASPMITQAALTSDAAGQIITIKAQNGRNVGAAAAPVGEGGYVKVEAGQPYASNRYGGEVHLVGTPAAQDGSDIWHGGVKIVSKGLDSVSKVIVEFLNVTSSGNNSATQKIHLLNDTYLDFYRHASNGGEMAITLRDSLVIGTKDGAAGRALHLAPVLTTSPTQLNVAFFDTQTGGYFDAKSMVGGLYVGNRTTAPSNNPDTGGFFFWAESGELRLNGPSALNVISVRTITGATGQNLILRGGNTTDSNAAGELLLRPGDSSSGTDGNVRIQNAAGTAVFSYVSSSGALEVNVSNMNWVSSVSAPTIKQNDLTSGTNGAPFTFQAQNNTTPNSNTVGGSVVIFAGNALGTGTGNRTGGDVTLTAGVAAVGSGTLTQGSIFFVAGASTMMGIRSTHIELYASPFQFYNTTVNPVIQQETRTSGSAQKLTIHAQNHSGGSSTGGAIDIGPGSGTSAGGIGRLINGAGAAKLLWDDSGVAIGALPSNWNSAVGAFFIADAGTPPTAPPSGGSLLYSSSSTFVISATNGLAVNAIGPLTVTGTTGTSMLVYGGGTTDSNTAGNLLLRAGNSTSGTDGDVNIQNGAGATVFQYSGVSNWMAVQIPVFSFGSTVVSPIIRQNDDAGASVTGDTLLIHAQNATGTTSTGGNLDLRPGSGTTAGGVGRLLSGAGVAKLFWGTNGVSIAAQPSSWNASTGGLFIGNGTAPTAGTTPTNGILIWGQNNDTLFMQANGTVKFYRPTATGSQTGGSYEIKAGDADSGTAGSITLRAGDSSSGTDGNLNFLKGAGTNALSYSAASNTWAVGAPTVAFDQTIGDITINQVAAGNATGSNLTVQAQSNNSASLAAGNLILASGENAGAGAEGNVLINRGSSNVITISDSQVQLATNYELNFIGAIDIRDDGTPYIGSDSTGVTIPINVMKFGSAPASTGVIRVSRSGIIMASRTEDGLNDVVYIANDSINTLYIGQESGSAAGLWLRSVAGVTFRVGAFTAATLSSTAWEWNVATARFDSAVVSPAINQEAVADVAGQNLVVQAQGNNSATLAAGSLVLRGGVNAGAGADGSIFLQTDNANRVTVLSTAIGIDVNTIFWASTVTTPNISQTALVDAAAVDMRIQAQGNNSATHAAGDLILAGGVNAGAGPDGAVIIQAAGSTVVTFDSSVTTFSPAIAVTSGGAAVPTTGYVRLARATTLIATLRNDGTTNMPLIGVTSDTFTISSSTHPGTIQMHAGSGFGVQWLVNNVQVGQINATKFEVNVTNALEIGSAVASPKIYQVAVGDVAGQDLLIQAQSNNSAAQVAGDLLLRAGDNTGAGAEGNVDIQSGPGTTVFRYDAVAGSMSMLVPDLNWGMSVASPGIRQANETAALTGEQFSIVAQNVTTTGSSGTVGGHLGLFAGDATGSGTGARTGGNVFMRPGSASTSSGTLTDGIVDIQNASGTSRFSVSNTVATITLATVQFAATVVAPKIFQFATGDATGEDLTIQAQGNASATLFSGALVLAGGVNSTSAARSGDVRINSGNRNLAVFTDYLGVGIPLFLINQDGLSATQSYMGVGSLGALDTNGSSLVVFAGDGGATNRSGGDLTLRSGEKTGSGIAGNVILQVGTDTSIRATIDSTSSTALSGTSSLLALTGMHLAFGATTSVPPDGYIRLPNGSAHAHVVAMNAAGTQRVTLITLDGVDDVTIGSALFVNDVHLRASATFDFQVFTAIPLEIGFTYLEVGVSSLRWDAAVSSPAISQVAVADVAGQNLTITAQNNNSATLAAGSLVLGGGSNAGAGADGAVQVTTAGTTRMEFLGDGSAVNVTVPIVQFTAAVVSPIIRQESDATASVTGDNLQMIAQSVTATSGNNTAGSLHLRGGIANGSGTGNRTGGDVIIDPGQGINGSGTNTDGTIRMRSAAGANVVIVRSDRAEWQTSMAVDFAGELEISRQTVAYITSASGVVQIEQGTLRFASTVLNPLVGQASDATAGITADTLQIIAQSATATTGNNVGGRLHLRGGEAIGSGTGDRTGGEVMLTPGQGLNGSGTNTDGTIVMRSAAGANVVIIRSNQLEMQGSNAVDWVTSLALSVGNTPVATSTTSLWSFAQSVSITAGGATPADAGLLRFPRQGSLIMVRNQVGDGNLMVLNTDSSNTIYLGEEGNSSQLWLRSATGITMRSGAFTAATLNSTRLELNTGTFQFDSAVSTPQFIQEAVADAVGQSLTIAAQGNNSTTNAAGNLILRGGTNAGSGSDGLTIIQYAGSDRFTVGNTAITIANGVDLDFAGSVRITAATALVMRSVSQDAYFVGAISSNTGTNLVLQRAGASVLQWSSDTKMEVLSATIEYDVALVPVFTQETAGDANGKIFTIRAQGNNSGTLTAGRLVLAGGTNAGAGSHGDISFVYGGVDQIRFAAGTIMWFASPTTAPVIEQDTDNAANATGDNLTIRAQDVTGSGTSITAGSMVLEAGDANAGTATTRIGGNITLRPGTGTTPGTGQLNDSTGANRFRWNGTGVGFNTASPVARPDYTVTNAVTNRSIDVSTINLANLAQVVGTIINDLITYGLYQ